MGDRICCSEGVPQYRINLSADHTHSTPSIEPTLSCIIMERQACHVSSYRNHSDETTRHGDVVHVRSIITYIDLPDRAICITYDISLSKGVRYTCLGLSRTNIEGSGVYQSLMRKSWSRKSGTCHVAKHRALTKYSSNHAKNRDTKTEGTVPSSLGVQFEKHRTHPVIDSGYHQIPYRRHA